MASATAVNGSTGASNGRPETYDADESGGGGGIAEVAGATVEALLTDAAIGPARRLLPGRASLKLASSLVSHPRNVAQHGAGLAAELAKIAVGRSEVAPSKGDKRFKDPAWEGNFAYRRLMQTYLAASHVVDDTIASAGLDWRTERRMRFAAENVIDALAPTNFPPTNPAVLKTALDTGGRSLVKGAMHMAQDMSRPPRIPSMVDSSAFAVGENLAVSPGAVVLRTPVFELIQYKPTTSKVHERPLLIVPPMINKYYVTDIAPGRSMIEHLVNSGQQVFAISWRNPDERHSEWNLDTYSQGVVDALGACEAISGQDATQVVGLCAGGITATGVVGHLAAIGELDRVAGLTLAVCVLDQEGAGMAGAFVDQTSAALSVAESSRKGYLDGRTLAGVFAWMRPNDLIWNYWVNNYLLGKEPPAFDVLYWNADTTRMPAGLHRDFMQSALENSLVTPGQHKVLGTGIDLSQITVDTYLVAGIADHITPWESNYRSTKLLGSEPRFVLSTSGHIAAMVNPPGNEKASYRIAEKNPPDPESFMKAAVQKQGTWWEDWSEWLGQRSGEERRAPAKLGAKGHKPLEDAPGTYVLQS